MTRSMVPEDAIAQTVESMRAAATGPFGKDGPMVEGTARNIVQTDTPTAESGKRIEDWVLERAGYFPDPTAREVLTTPETMLAQVRERGRCYGDADEIAVLVAAMGLSIGLDAQFVLVTFEGRPFSSHVFARLKVRDTEWDPNPIAKKTYADRVTAWATIPVNDE